MIVNGEACKLALHHLNEDNFTDDRHKIMVKALKGFRPQQGETRITALRNQLEQQGQIEQVGGLDFLKEVYTFGVQCDINPIITYLKRIP